MIEFVENSTRRVSITFQYNDAYNAIKRANINNSFKKGNITYKALGKYSTTIPRPIPILQYFHVVFKYLIPISNNRLSFSHYSIPIFNTELPFF